MSAAKRIQSPNTFIYRLLDPDAGEIRLMRIERSDDETRPVQIKVKHVPLNDQPDYTALSYTWGSESPTFDIYIYGDGSAADVFSVRQNLHDFLLEMRSDGDESWFWVDQICINQNDQEEKSQQVRRMPEIYTKARGVLIWLGTAFEGSDDLMERVSFYSETSASEIRERAEAYIVHGQEGERQGKDDHGHTKCKWTNRWEARQPSTPSRMSRRNELEELWKKHRPICRRLVGLAYFKRVWIIQEIRLNYRRTVRLGSKSATWHYLMTFLSYMRNPDDRSYGSVRNREPGLRRIEGCGYYVSLDLFDETGDGEHTWYDMLYLVVSSQCTNPRDKAYAMLGLLPERLRIYPDYGLEDFEIVCQLIRKQIADTLAHLDNSCLKGDYKQQHYRYDRWKWAKKLTVVNVAESFNAALCTSIWYYEMHQGYINGYEPQRVRSFLLNEVFPAFRKQRMAQGSEWGYHGWTERVIARVLAPREKGFVFWCYRRIFPKLSRIR